MSFASFDPANDESGLPIVLREPRQSWKANLFWGLALGVPAVLGAWFAPAGSDFLERWGLFALGLAWLVFMGANAYRNFGRTLRCDMETITVSQAFASKRIALADVASVEREDVRKQVREFEQVGMSWRDKARQMDTAGAVNMVVLRDAAGKTLLRVDEEMEPGDEMQRFVKRVRRAAVQNKGAGGTDG